MPLPFPIRQPPNGCGMAMGMSTPAEQIEAVSETAPKARVLAVEVGGWPGLGGRVRVELGEARTVLVGKNGVGKSLLLEGITEATRRPSFPNYSLRDKPAIEFRCDVEVPGEPPVAYEYQDSFRYREEGPGFTGVNGTWQERCWSPADGRPFWQVKDDVLVLGGRSPVPYAPGIGYLIDRKQAGYTHEADVLRRMLTGFRFIRAGVPRAARREILVGGDGRPLPRDRVDSMAKDLVDLYDEKRAVYDELVTILRSIGLLREMEIKIYQERGNSAGASLASVVIDGVNIGLVSDGTLRVCEIILGLLEETATVLLVEEPEDAVHPGLLHKLLAVIDSYTLDRQIVVSTHSPTVVDWCRPTELRLVEREAGTTTVRALSAEQVQRVEAYLNDQGTFADFVLLPGRRMTTRKIGILAEDQTDCDTVGTLVRRLVAEADRPPVGLKKIGYKGCAKLRNKAAADMKLLARDGYGAVVVVHDLDRSPDNGMLNDERALRERLVAIEVPNGIERLVCIPVEELEAWFWSDPAIVREVGRGRGRDHAEPHRIPKPKEALQNLSRGANAKPRYSTVDNATLAGRLDMGLCAARCPAFRELRDFVRSVIT